MMLVLPVFWSPRNTILNFVLLATELVERFILILRLKYTYYTLMKPDAPEFSQHLFNLYDDYCCSYPAH